MILTRLITDLLLMFVFFFSDQILNDIFADKKSTFHSQLNQQNPEVIPPDTNIVQTSLDSSNVRQPNQSLTRLSNLVSKFTNNFNIGLPNNNGQDVIQTPALVPPRDSFPQSVPLFASGVAFPSVPSVPIASGTTAPPLFVNQDSNIPHSVPLFPTSNLGIIQVQKPPSNTVGKYNK